MTQDAYRNWRNWWRTALEQLTKLHETGNEAALEATMQAVAAAAVEEGRRRRSCDEQKPAETPTQAIRKILADLTIPQGAHDSVVTAAVDRAVKAVEGLEVPADPLVEALDMQGDSTPDEPEQMDARQLARAIESAERLSGVLDTSPRRYSAAGALRAARAALPHGWEAVRAALEEAQAPGLMRVQWSGLMEAGKEPMRWLIPQWLPATGAHLIYGEGEIGKSRLIRQLCTSLAAGERRWLPLHDRADDDRLALTPAGEDGNVVYASWEDDRAATGRMLKELADGKELSTGDETFTYLDASGRGPIWGPRRDGSGHTSTEGHLTPLGAALRRHGTGADVLVIDTLAAAYGLNENDRSLVRSFLSDWDAWARDNELLLLLIGHPSKASKNGASGSTDWRNAPRSAWELRMNETGWEHEEEEIKAPYLSLLKGSYSHPKPEGVWLQAKGIEWQRSQSAREAAAAARGVPAEALQQATEETQGQPRRPSQGGRRKRARGNEAGTQEKASDEENERLLQALAEARGASPPAGGGRKLTEADRDRARRASARMRGHSPIQIERMVEQLGARKTMEQLGTSWDADPRKPNGEGAEHG